MPGRGRLFCNFRNRCRTNGRGRDHVENSCRYDPRGRALGAGGPEIRRARRHHRLRQRPGAGGLDGGASRYWGAGSGPATDPSQPEREGLGRVWPPESACSRGMRERDVDDGRLVPAPPTTTRGYATYLGHRELPESSGEPCIMLRSTYRRSVARRTKCTSRVNLL